MTALTAKPKREIDLEAAERDYRAGVMSVCEVARRYGVSEGAVRKWAKAFGWQRELGARIQRAVADRAIRAEVADPVRVDEVRIRGTNSGTSLPPADQMTDDQIVEAYADAGAAAIRLHRRDLMLLRNRRNRLMQHWDRAVPELSGPQPIGPDGALLPEAALRIDQITQAAAILESVSRIDERIVKIERQALGIDAAPPAPPEDPAEVARREESRQAVMRLMGDLARRVTEGETVTLDGTIAPGSVDKS